MSDLIERLRTCKHAPAMVLCHEAADRIAELEPHIRAIAEHHVTAIGSILPTHYHTQRRDFALSIFTKGE